MRHASRQFFLYSPAIDSPLYKVRKESLWRKKSRIFDWWNEFREFFAIPSCVVRFFFRLSLTELSDLCRFI